MSTPYIIFFTLATSHLFLMGIYFLFHYGRNSFARLLSAFFICIVGYLAATVPGDFANLSPYFEIVLHRFGDASVLLLWVIAHRLFMQERHIPSRVWWLGGCYMALKAIGSTFSQLGIPYDTIFLLLTYGVSEVITIGFVVHAFYLALNEFETDLVLERRSERIAFVLGMGVLMVMIAINRIHRIVYLFNDLNDDRAALIPTYYYSIYLYLAAVGFFIWRFRLSQGPILEAVERTQSDELSADESANLKQEDLDLIGKVKLAMEQDKLFMQHQLTVAKLAKHIGSQEYKVRRAINQQLNFKNFSDFVNQYRIAESTRRLSETDESISNIGMDIGYTSLSSFHKVFKEKHHVTPKEYRRRCQATA